MPAVPPTPRATSSGAASYLKGNAKFAYGGGAIGGLLLASDIKGILDADNKFKALLKTLKDFILIRVLVGTVFGSIAKGIRDMVRDTGSLDQALKKLGQMQGFARGLSSFVGGLSVARKRIVELSELSSRGPFKFEDIAEANKSLEVFTRGTFSSVEATKLVGKVAIATGSDINDVAKSVGMFYDALRNGQPVQAITEQMRQMGVISQADAEHLNKMSEGGEDTASAMLQLNDALKKTSEASKGYKQELASITEEYEKLTHALMEKFAAPFTEDAVKNMQNTNAAMKAITPSVAQVAKGAAALYSGFGTATTGIVKFLAQSETLRGILKGILVAIGALSAAMLVFGATSAMSLSRVIISITQNLVAMGGAAGAAGIALRTAGLLGIWGLLAAGVATAVGAIINMSAAVKKVKKEYDDWVKSQNEATAALQAQVAAITTLTEKQAALAAAIKRIIDLQKEKEALDDKEKHRKDEPRKLGTGWAYSRVDNEGKLIKEGQQAELNMIGRIVYRWMGWTKQRKLDREKDKQLVLDTQKAEEQKEKAARTQTVNKELLEQEAERRSQIEAQTKGIKQRDREAEAGLKAQAALEKDLGENDAKRITVQGQLDKARDKFNLRENRTPEQQAKHQKKFEEAEDKLKDLAKERIAIQLKAPEFSHVYLEAKAEQLRQAKDASILQAQLDARTDISAEERLKKEKEISRTKEKAGEEAMKTYKETPGALPEAEIAAAQAKKREEKRPSPEELRQIEVRKLDISTEIEGKAARRRGDIKEAQAFEDLSKFSHHAEELMSAGFGKTEALELAKKQTETDIKEEYAQARPPVGSMRELGLGGNLPQVDASMEINRRMAGYQEKMVGYLAILAGQDQPGQAPATFQ